MLGADNRGKGRALAAAVEWTVGQGIAVVNLSLSSRSEAMFAAFHALADRSYFANTLLVCAANNVPGPSYPSLFAAVLSVAAHDVADPDTWFYNPAPPVEFGAHGVDVDVAWRDGGRIRATGNSFAAPHLAGQAARLRSRYPAATPFEIKALLAATATDPRHDEPPGGAGRSTPLWCVTGSLGRYLRLWPSTSSSSSVGVASPPWPGTWLAEARRRRGRQAVALDVVLVDEWLPGVSPRARRASPSGACTSSSDRYPPDRRRASAVRSNVGADCTPADALTEGHSRPGRCRLGDILRKPARPCTSGGSASTLGRGVRRSRSASWSGPARRGRSAASVRVSRDVSVENTSFWISGTLIVARSVVGRHLEQGRVRVGHDVGRPGAAGQRGDLAEEVALAHRRQAAVAAVLRDAGGGRPFEDEVRRRRGVAVLDDARAGRDLADRRVADERIALFGREPRERREPGRPGGRNRRAWPAGAGSRPAPVRSRPPRAGRAPRGATGCPGLARSGRSRPQPNSRTAEKAMRPRTLTTSASPAPAMPNRKITSRIT